MRCKQLFLFPLCIDNCQAMLPRHSKGRSGGSIVEKGKTNSSYASAVQIRSCKIAESHASGVVAEKFGFRQGKNAVPFQERAR